jgi:hypothetical protein
LSNRVKNIFENDGNNIIKMYLSGIGAQALGKIFGPNQKTILKFLREKNVKINRIGYNQYKNKHGAFQDNGIGYLISVDRFGNRCYIHRACWEAYNRPIPEGYVVHHVDGNQRNNNIENLECLSETEHKSLEMKKRRRRKSD